MFPGNFFTIVELNSANGGISAIISLNTGHPIYQGHFPGMPVVPGVCQIEIVKEVLCSGRSGSFLLSESKVCKFLYVMNPLDISDLKCEIAWSEMAENSISFSGELFDDNRTYLKIKGIVKRENG